MRLRTFNLILLLLLSATGCGVRADAPTPEIVFVTPAFDSTLTRTPFLPEGQPTLTPTWTGLPTVTLRPSQTPTLDPSIPTATSTRLYATLQSTPAYTLTPAPAALLPQPQGQVSILLLGSDERPASTSFRTDTMILLTLRADGTASVVSFPRDLYVYIPGFKMARINAPYLYGGFDLLATTFEYNFGIRPQHYVITNFNGFQSIVNSLGGVDVSVGQAMHAARSGYSDGYSLEPGIVHMDGEMALWYLRARYETSDFDRLRRTQEVLFAIGQRLLSFDALNHIPEFYEAYKQSVATDLSLEDLLAFLPILKAVDIANIQRYTLTNDYFTPWIEPGTGSNYLLPNTGQIQLLLRQAVGTP